MYVSSLKVHSQGCIQENLRNLCAFSFHFRLLLVTNFNSISFVVKLFQCFQLQNTLENVRVYVRSLGMERELWRKQLFKCIACALLLTHIHTHVYTECLRKLNESLIFNIICAKFFRHSVCIVFLISFGS